MSSPTPAKQEKSATKPRQKIQGHTEIIYGILRLPDKRRIMTCGWDGLIRIWDLENGTQVDAWKDEETVKVRMLTIALSPDGKKVASGSDDAVRLWDIDTGKVIKKWTGHSKDVWSVCWSPDGGRVVSRSEDKTFIVWDVESGNIILGPIEAGNDHLDAVCYSPDGTTIATGHVKELKVWDASTGRLLKTLKIDGAWVLAWTLDGKTLIAGAIKIRKFDTATWTETTVLKGHISTILTLSLSSNERILVSASHDNTVRLWNLETNQPIGQPLRHEDQVKCAALSADGKFLATGCTNGRIYTWEVSVILREAGLDDLLSDNANAVNKSALDTDATRQRVPRIKDARRTVPSGFFDDAPHRADFSTSRRATEHSTQSRSRVLSWAQNFASGMLRGRRLHVPPVVEVPLTAGKPRDYHARGKKAATSPRPPNPRTTQQHSRSTHTNLSSSQQPPATATASTSPPADAATAGTTGTHLTIRDAGWRTRFMLWACCVPIQNIDCQH